MNWVVLFVYIRPVGLTATTWLVTGRRIKKPVILEHMGLMTCNFSGSVGAQWLHHSSALRKGALFVKPWVKERCKLLSSLRLLFTGVLFTVGEIAGEEDTHGRVFPYCWLDLKIMKGDLSVTYVTCMSRGRYWISRLTWDKKWKTTNITD